MSITIETNLNIVDFLDVTFDLRLNKYSPFKKPDEIPLYVNSNSNHPPCIIKRIPEMISERISNLSCNSKEFDKVKESYGTALTDSGYKQPMKFVPKREKKKTRKRNILWFNPPFSKNVKTNVGKKFMNLIRKHFPADHKFHKIFNFNNIKISYSCTPNIKNVIQQHNSKNLQSPKIKETKPCNCRNPTDCPLTNKCLTRSIVYQATVIANTSEHIYFGISDTEFKDRYNNHIKSFNQRRYEKETELSKFIWSLKDQGIHYSIRWSIATNGFSYRNGGSRCDLCNSEKVIIARSNHKGLINKRTELVSKCRHKNKFMLKNWKGNS